MLQVEVLVITQGISILYICLGVGVITVSNMLGTDRAIRVLKGKGMTRAEGGGGGGIVTSRCIGILTVLLQCWGRVLTLGSSRGVSPLIGIILLVVSLTLACSGAEGWECVRVAGECLGDAVGDVAKEAMEGNGELGLVTDGSVIRWSVGEVWLAVPLLHVGVPYCGPEVSVARPVTSCTSDTKARGGGGDYGGQHAAKLVTNGRHAHVAEGTWENWSSMAEAVELINVDEGRAEDGWFALEKIHEELEIGEVRVSCRFLIKHCAIEATNVLDRLEECLGDHFGV